MDMGCLIMILASIRVDKSDHVIRVLASDWLILPDTDLIRGQAPSIKHQI